MLIPSNKLMFVMWDVLQVLDKNTVKLVAGEYDLLVIDKEEVNVTDAAKKTNDFLDLDDLDHVVSHTVTILHSR